MYKLWEVQTFYGTERKTFQSEHHAIKYAKQLEQSMIDRGQDEGLVEINVYEADAEEYIYTTLAD